ncbi:hypothetical protein [Xanthomonas cucurbitae]|uniref:hypothetical protein n=1 Tax=Xanthomonas cucurbitae TaxID=56453 RepID=UPI0014743838|nr:hypothetical protein [Xanthomonas cucurbitae]WDM69912.1 hypothetical protein K6981_06290 [Xanthomonas cucurbitae]
MDISLTDRVINGATARRVPCYCIRRAKHNGEFGVYLAVSVESFAGFVMACAWPR